MSYVQVKLLPTGNIESTKSIVIVQGRADATEVVWSDAVLLQGRAQQLRRDLDWQIERTYSGKYVVRGLSKG